jgi:hypothetical protein
MIKLAAKKTLINSRGFSRQKAPVRISMPNNRKKRDKIVIIKFLHHQAIEPMHSFLLRLAEVFHTKVVQY